MVPPNHRAAILHADCLDKLVDGNFRRKEGFLQMLASQLRPHLSRRQRRERGQREFSKL